MIWLAVDKIGRETIHDNKPEFKSIETTDTTELDFDVYEMEYEGHTYYVFSKQGTTISVLHSPDCDVCKE